MALVVSFLQGELSAEEVAVGKVVAAEVVEVCDALGSGVEGKQGRLSVDGEEELLGVAELAGLKEEFQAGVGRQVDADAFVVGV